MSSSYSVGTGNTLLRNLVNLNGIQSWNLLSYNESRNWFTQNMLKCTVMDQIRFSSTTFKSESQLRNKKVILWDIKLFIVSYKVLQYNVLWDLDTYGFIIYNVWLYISQHYVLIFQLYTVIWWVRIVRDKYCEILGMNCEIKQYCEL